MIELRLTKLEGTKTRAKFGDNTDPLVYIEIDTTESKFSNKEIGEEIHQQLAGNQYYIDSAIVLNINEENKVKLYMFSDCDDELTIIREIIKNKKEGNYNENKNRIIKERNGTYQKDC